MRGTPICGMATASKGALADVMEAIRTAPPAEDTDTPWLDLTKPLARKRLGTLHPVTIVTNQVVDIFVSMG